MKTFLCLSLLISLSFSLEIGVYLNGSVVYSYYDSSALFQSRSNVQYYYEGDLVYVVPRNACSAVDLPPVSDYYIALVPNYDDCPTENYFNLFFAGYQMMLTYSPSSLAVDNAILPTVIIQSDKIAFLTFLENLLANDSSPVLITVKEEYFLLYQRIIIIICFVLMAAISLALCVFFCSCCTKWLIVKWRRRGLTRWRIRQLPQRRYRSAEETSHTCSICLEDFKDGEKLRVLPCDHVFHPSCVDEWLRKWNRTCPLCKSSISRKRVRVEEPSGEGRGLLDNGENEEGYGATEERATLAEQNDSGQSDPI